MEPRISHSTYTCKEERPVTGRYRRRESRDSAHRAAGSKVRRMADGVYHVPALPVTTIEEQEDVLMKKATYLEREV